MCLTVQMALALRLGGVGTSISKEDKDDDDDDDDGTISVTRQMAQAEESVKLSWLHQLANVIQVFNSVSKLHRTKNADVILLFKILWKSIQPQQISKDDHPMNCVASLLKLVY